LRWFRPALGAKGEAAAPRWLTIATGGWLTSNRRLVRSSLVEQSQLLIDQDDMVGLFRLGHDPPHALEVLDVQLTNALQIGP